MPERVHKRLDEKSMPLETAINENVPLLTEHNSRKRKRKREHIEETYPKKHAKALESSHKTLPIYHDQPQQSNVSVGSQPLVSVNHKPKAPSGPSNGGQNLKDRAKSLESSRKSLPIWSHVTEIHDALLGTDIMILVGETGSGKSTQVPQMLVNEAWCKPQWVPVPQDVSNVRSSPGASTILTDSSPQTVRVGGCIAITEPRRVAATTLARRVAEEMGTPLGSNSPKSTVGYSVRFDQSTSPNTRIKFLTEGTLLQEMLRDPWLKAYSAVFVDEVHERGANVDLLLGFLRNIVAGKNEGRGGIPLKVCLLGSFSLVVLMRLVHDNRLPVLQ